LSINKIYFTGNGGHRYRDGDIIRFDDQCYVEPYSLILGGQVIPTIGSFSYTWSEFLVETTIGRYCSISWNTRILYNNHPLDRISTSSFSYDADCIIFSQCLEDFSVTDFCYSAPVELRPGRNASPVIENDVWIGQDVTLARGITLGNGCVVGAGSLVTKSVPPFAIVGGNPARIIRFRFDERTIEQLLRIRWWDYKFSDLVGMPLDNIPRFLNELEDRIAQKKITPYVPPKLRLASLLTSTAIDQ
jgi:acetyltransferase-like isoleucine patch superfamily enzyme